MCQCDILSHKKFFYLFYADSNTVIIPYILLIKTPNSNVLYFKTLVLFLINIIKITIYYLNQCLMLIKITFT